MISSSTYKYGIEICCCHVLIHTVVTILMIRNVQLLHLHIIVNQRSITIALLSSARLMVEKFTRIDYIIYHLRYRHNLIKLNTSR